MTTPTTRAGLVKLMAEPVKCLTPIGAEAILAALEAAGLRVVPAVETRQMFLAGRGRMATPEIYRAMVATSPFAPEREARDG